MFNSFEEFIEATVKAREELKEAPEYSPVFKEDEERFLAPFSNPRWWWGESYTPKCFYCKHFRGLIKGKKRCRAYPQGIADKILN